MSDIASDRAGLSRSSPRSAVVMVRALGFCAPRIVMHTIAALVGDAETVEVLKDGGVDYAPGLLSRQAPPVSGAPSL